MNYISQKQIEVEKKPVSIINPEIEDQTVTGIGRLKARSNLIPAQKKDVYYKNKEESVFLQSLNGEWRFKYRKADDIADFFKISVDDWDFIDVPSMWQYRGYGQCRYSNVEYPIPFNPPYVSCENPVGYYRRKFIIDELKSHIILHFGGVDSAYYVYINGRFAGFSKGSRIPAEFDVTGLVGKGENDIAVKVFTYCDGTYLENQDMLTASGIFRDVYLLHTADVTLWDYRVLSSVSGFKIELSFLGMNFNKSYVEITLDGQSQIFDVADKIECEFKIENPRFWNSEEPNLYQLYIAVHTPDGNCEIHSKKVGILFSEIRDGNFFVNGKPVYIKGINRHEYDCKNGRAVSVELIEKELRMIKANNINAIRCSHYTNNPAFYELCSEIGIFVMDEADLETHGCGATGDQGYLSKKQEWLCAYMDRVDRMLNQNKNEVCIFMRSVGNECGRGENMIECLKHIIEFDPTKAAIHDQQEFPKNFESTEHGEYDFIRRVGYVSRKDIKRQSATQQVYMLIEYAHAMGNSPGFLEGYQKLVYEIDNFIGGFVWEFKNHGFYSEDDKGNPYYKYGGDFENDNPNWSNFCLDGYLMSDGTPKHTWYELGEVFSPVYATMQNGVIKLKNTYNFKNLNCITLKWNICEDFEIVKSGEIHLPSVKPHDETIIDIDTNLTDIKEGARYYLNLSFFDGGINVGNNQFKLKEKSSKESARNSFGGSIDFVGNKICVSGDDWCFEFENGMFAKLKMNNKVIVDDPLEFNFWRAPTDNDGIMGMDSAFYRNVEKWKNSAIDTFGFFANDVKAYKSQGMAVVESCGKILPMSKYLGFNATVKYIIDGDGLMTVDIKGIPYGKFPANLPRIGVHLAVNKDIRTATWYGRGKRENYSDCTKASPVGLYSTDIKDTYTVYDVPQETGNHENTVFASFASDTASLTFIGCNEFSFSYHDFTLDNLTNAKHRNELKKDCKNHIYIDYKMRGLGSHSCGPEPEEEFELRPHAFEFAFAVAANIDKNDALKIARCNFGMCSGALENDSEIQIAVKEDIALL